MSIKLGNKSGYKGERLAAEPLTLHRVVFLLRRRRHPFSPYLAPTGLIGLYVLDRLGGLSSQFSLGR